MATMYFVRTSARPQVEGYISGVKEAYGKSHFSDFTISNDAGVVAAVRADYTGPGLRVGDRVRVRFVQYNRKLLELTMLSGSFTGWELRESSGEWGGAWMGLVGVACGMGAWRAWGKSVSSNGAVAGN